MTPPPGLTSLANLSLALDRVIRGTNRDYKQYSRFLYPSYSLAQPALLDSLSIELKKDTYAPSPPTLIYQPKKTGILRPLAILTLKDQIVYQAILNRIANRVHLEQKKLALVKRFGALYAGSRSPFFFRSWKVAYASYNRSLASAFNSGKRWLAEFDLVSCYELIDHNLLKARLRSYRVDQGTLELLGKCLAAWTTNAGSHVRHGVPQGPEASAFLAECVLFKFDNQQLGNVAYLRYIDDIRLLAKDEVSLRKALLRLDLTSKDLGLVPQAQKINVRECRSVAEVTKTIPSSMVGIPPARIRRKQKQLLAMWRKSLKRERGRWLVTNQTSFRFSLYRLNPRRLVLRRIAQLLLARPDLSAILSYYFSRFPQDREAADLLLAALRQDPTYDFAASAYIEALDVCEPTTKTASYRRVIQTTTRRSIEKTILVRVAALRFRVRRAGVADAIKLLSTEANSLVVGLVLSAICAEAGGSPFAASALEPLLRRAASGPDPDLARFAAALSLDTASKAGAPWKPPTALNPAVAELLVAVGLRSRGPVRKTAVQIYLERHGVVTPLAWKKALGPDLADLERRAVRLQHLRLIDPSAFVLMLDTFNEALLQSFSRLHPSLAKPFAAASGGLTHPDYGNWLNNGALAAILPTSIGWFQGAHRLRLQADLAHAKHRKGPQGGKPTKAVSFQEVNALMGKGPAAWEALIHEWRSFV